MRLYSVHGDVLFKSSFITIKESVEEAINQGVNLNYINLRKANLKNAEIDKAHMAYACLWGADLTKANVGDAVLNGADFRAANLKETCFANSDCHDTNFQGAYFSKTILYKADLSFCQFSCPSIFQCDLNDVASLKGTLYYHLGETICSLSKAPIIIRGLEKPVVVMDEVLLIGQEHIQKLPIIDLQKNIISELCKRIIQS